MKKINDKSNKIKKDKINVEREKKKCKRKTN